MATITKDSKEVQSFFWCSHTCSGTEGPASINVKRCPDHRYKKVIHWLNDILTFQMYLIKNERAAGSKYSTGMCRSLTWMSSLDAAEEGWDECDHVMHCHVRVVLCLLPRHTFACNRNFSFSNVPNYYFFRQWCLLSRIFVLSSYFTWVHRPPSGLFSGYFSFSRELKSIKSMILRLTSN